MLETMYAAPGVGLAAPQVGIEKSLFVYDVGEGPGALCNPVIAETWGEIARDEGCLSVPGLWFELTRPERVVAKGLDLEGEPVEVYGEGLMARMLMHETDHLGGMLLIDRLERSRRKEAMRIIRAQAEGGPVERSPRHDPDA